jgi:hypothetical protein
MLMMATTARHYCASDDDMMYLIRPLDYGGWWCVKSVIGCEKWWRDFRSASTRAM